MRAAIPIVLALGLLGAAAAPLLRERQAGPHGTGERCTSCHASDAPRVHTPDFVARGHGTAAYLNAATCTACHARSSCDACHSEKRSMPHDHTPEFRAVRGAGRAAHIAAARLRPQACATCHAARHGTTCGRCHAPGAEVRR